MLSLHFISKNETACKTPINGSLKIICMWMDCAITKTATTENPGLIISMQFYKIWSLSDHWKKGFFFFFKHSTICRDMGTGSCSNRVGTLEGKICRQYHFKGSLALITFDTLIQVIFIDFWLQKSQLLKSHQKSWVHKTSSSPNLGK